MTALAVSDAWVCPAVVAPTPNCLNSEMVLGSVAQIVVVLVPSLTRLENMTTVEARQLVGMWTSASANLNVDTLTRLNLVSVARGIRRWS